MEGLGFPPQSTEGCVETAAAGGDAGYVQQKGGYGKGSGCGKQDDPGDVVAAVAGVMCLVQAVFDAAEVKGGQSGQGLQADQGQQAYEDDGSIVAAVQLFDGGVIVVSHSIGSVAFFGADLLLDVSKGQDGQLPAAPVRYGEAGMGYALVVDDYLTRRVRPLRTNVGGLVFGSDGHGFSTV